MGAQNMDNRYKPVSSNDMLLHLSLPKSPETLCGRIVVDEVQNPTSAGTALNCDLCNTLSGGNVFLKTNEKQTAHLASVHQIDISRVPAEILNDEDALTLFHKQAHVFEAAGPGSRDDITGAPPASGFSTTQCSKCGQLLSPGQTACPSCGNVTESSSTPNSAPLSGADRETRQIERSQGFGVASSTKDSKHRNWTRSGVPIEDGFTLILTSKEASEIPYLDTTRVSISDKIHCNDCETDTWLSKAASCTDCGEFKCDNCMDSSTYDLFIGTCKKCATIDVEAELYYIRDEDDELDYEVVQRTAAFLHDDEDEDDEITFLSPPIEE
jgi:uncharacterized Zn finger protein (UPF0148 family)